MVISSEIPVYWQETLSLKKMKDWMKKYHKIIWRLETIANIQLQIQDIVKQAKKA